MKKLVLLITVFLSLSAYAGKVLTPTYLIKYYLPQVTEQMKKRDYSNVVDFKMIEKANEAWTKERVITLFESFKGEEIIIVDEEDFSKAEVEVTAPIKATFTFEKRQRSVPKNTSMVGIYYTLIAIGVEE